MSLLHRGHNSKIYKENTHIEDMEKEEYNSKFGKYGPHTERNPNRPEERETWSKRIMVGVGLIAIASAIMASLWGCYQYATRDQERAYQERLEKQHRR